MKILDCTLRDGGYKVNFNWSIPFVKKYLSLCERLKIDYVELGYWKQGGNTFFCINEQIVNELKTFCKTCVMIDYEYCSKNIRDYSNCVDMIRMTCLPEHINEGSEFLWNLKQKLNISVGFNIIHISDYDLTSLNKIIHDIPQFDILYFSDSYGHVNLQENAELLTILKQYNGKTGFHLHSHSGLELSNYYMCKKYEIDYIDCTISGIGKGAGNLATECVVGDYIRVLQFIEDEPELTHKYDPYMFILGKEGKHLSNYYKYKDKSLTEFKNLVCFR